MTVLSRSADHLYWMARQVERAENAARILDVSNRIDPEASSAVSSVECQLLSCHLRPRDPAAAVRRDAPATDYCVDSAVLFACVRGAHQHHKPAPLARPKAGRALVIDVHFLVCQCSHLCESHEFKRVEAQVDSSGHNHIHVASRQPRAGVGDRQQ